MLQKIGFRYKLFILPLFCILGLFCWTLVNVHYTRGVSRKIDELAANTFPAWEMNRSLRKLLRSTQDAVLNAFAAGDPAALKNAESVRTQFLARMDTEKNNPLFDTQRYQGVKEMYQNYYSTATAEFTRQLKREAGARAKMDTTATAPVYNELRSKLDAITLDCEKQIQAGLLAMKTKNQREIWIILAAMGCCLAIILGLTFFINPTFLNPLKIATDVADMVARGDLTVRVPSYEGTDEMCNLLRVFRTMVENLRTLTEQIKEAVSALASAATEISASVTEIASGATETATAANETSTTVEEVRQTALDANRKAKHVSESAQRAVQISQSGERAVVTTVEGIRRIEVQMESIAESIMKLSEHGQAIGGIIATVEDVAEQSNLLAVNASIEAARAGEHGKGFAVVAHEVKSLAEQSKQSTSRVRNILDDIQKATSGAVMTTEQGSKAVEAGVKQSQDAGDSIQRLAASVEEAAQATTQIAVSSQEQLVGMDQVVAAMESIKQASAQNVTATKQVESAAHDLQELGQRLKHLVEQYKL
jgi:methyl-accepting chemotaxis protein